MWRSGVRGSSWPCRKDAAGPEVKTVTKAKFKISGVGSVALAALLAVNPLGLEFDGDKGFRLEPAKAFAKGGDDDGDDSGDDDSGGHGGGGDSDDSDDSDGDHGDDDHGDDDDHGGWDDSDHDDRGRGRGRGRGDHVRNDDRKGGHRAGTGTESGGVQVTKVEETAWGIEVEYSSGEKEEIENGRYERKDASGRTVLERPASAEDFGRIQSNVTNSGLTLGAPAAGSGAHLSPDAQARKIEHAGSAIEVRYRDGWKEEIEAGRYQLKDPHNQTVVERPATQADHDRLRALAGR